MPGRRRGRLSLGRASEGDLGGGHKMKKTLMILGGIFVVVTLAVVGVITIAAVKGSALDRESKAYVDEAVPAIVSEWDIREIQKRASPEFDDAVKQDDLEKMMRMYR